MKRWMTVLCAFLLTGCATYHSRPLPTAPDLSPTPSPTVPVSRLDLPGLEPEPFDPAHGLSETNVVTLAVLNDPDLKAARLRAGVAAAQMLEARLIPDPQLAGGVSRSTRFSGYDATVTEEIRALIRRRAKRAGAAAQAEQVNLQILWQEWQVAEKARELFIQANADEQLRAVLDQRRRLLTELYRDDRLALERRNLTAGTLTADFGSLSAAEAQFRSMQLQANQTRHALDRLLGLEPDVMLRLKTPPAMPVLPARQLRADLATLPTRRADLLALQAGYRAQEQRVRDAILAQFPVISAGVQKSRGAEEGVQSRGFAVNVNLPFFDRNRGQIAIQRASRAQLHQAYQARLDQAVGEADQLWKAGQIMARQLDALRTSLPVLEQTAAAAGRSLQDGNVDLPTYARVQSNALAAKANVIRLHASLARSRSALAMLLALPFGDVAGDTDHRR